MTILEAEDCTRIHRGSLEVLESLGVRVDDAEILALLRRHPAAEHLTPEHAGELERIADRFLGALSA